VAEAESLKRNEIHNLYTGHSSWLQNWLRGKLDCSDTAADLAHDTFIRVMQKQRSDESFNILYPRSYLRMVANSLMVDLFRRRSVEKAYLEALAHFPEAVSISAEEREIILQTLQHLDQLLENLPNAARQAFLLSRIDGLTYAEISQRLGVSQRTVTRYMQQAFELCLELTL